MLQKLCIPMVLSSILLATSVQADEKGMYLGVDLGNYQTEEQDINSSKAGLGLSMGYTVNEYVDLEASVFNIGNHSDIGLKANGLSISAIGKYSVGKGWQLIGEFGGVTLNQSVDLTASPKDKNGQSTLVDGRDSSLFMGYGVRYQNEDLSIYLKRSHADTDADLNILRLGVQYKID